MSDPVNTNESNGSRPKQKPELRLRSQAVSRGIATGKVICLYGSNRQFFHLTIPEPQVPTEIKRFEKAIQNAFHQLKRIVSAQQSQNGVLKDIFDTHRMILEDQSFQSKILKQIAESKMNAEWAVKFVGDSYVAQYKSIQDEHLREKYIDIQDITERILNALGGSGDGRLRLAADSVIAAEELRPSTLVELAGSRPRGLITEHGGWTSHTFILAREVNIPAVTGLPNIFHRLETGDSVIVNGDTGEVILNPKEETFRAFAALTPRQQDLISAESSPFEPLKTIDGREITIRANLDIPSDFSRAKRFGATGIGLYRSEFLFNQFKGYPTENQQYSAYKRIAEAAGKDAVKLRTFDLGVDQLVDRPISREPNPALGLRGVRLSLSSPKQLRIQIRAMLRASVEGDLDIVIPMVSGITEVNDVKHWIETERESLKSKGIPIGSPRVGVMIEVPSAVLLVDELLEECEFLCLGTNDLVQYLTAVDRDNENVARWFRTLHPAMIRAVRKVLDAGISAGKQVIVCGEMAGSPFYTPLLIGLGAVDFSMNVNSIPRVRKVTAGIGFNETADLVKNIENCRTANEIETVVRNTIRERWSHLFPAEFMDARKS